MVLRDANAWLGARRSTLFIQWAFTKVPGASPFCVLMRERWLGSEGSKSSLQGTNLMISGYSLGLMDTEEPKLSERRVELGSDANFLNQEADSGESMSRRNALWLRC